MVFRRARGISLTAVGTEWELYNYLQHTGAVLGAVELEILRVANEWMTTAEIAGCIAAGADGHRLLPAQLQHLANIGGLVVRDTPQADLDNRYADRWSWGTTAALYHFSNRGLRYVSPAVAHDWMKHHAASKRTVPLFRTNTACTTVVHLAPPDLCCEPLGLMSRRRSYRGFGPDPVAVSVLRDCLFAGFGINGFIVPEITNQGLLPVTMTPSGGARNPFEAYVVVRNVTDVVPGAYHYSASDNTLGLLESRVPRLGAVLADQGWFDEAAAVIVIVAVFERTMWKYPHFSGYRVVLLQAGHIAQNVLLTATAAGLAAAPTCALSDVLCAELFRLDPILEAPVYAVALGTKGPVPTVADPPRFLPNLAISGSVPGV